MQERLSQVIISGLLLALVFTALAHGTVEPWSVGIFRLLIAGLLALWGVSALLEHRLALVVPAPFWPVAGLLCVGLAQSVARPDAAGITRALSVNVEATRATVTTLACILAGGLLAATFLWGRRRMRAFHRLLTIYGLALAMLAIIQELAWNGSMYWIRPLTWEAPSVFGPFINHNHFAGYLELLAPLPVGLILTGVVRGPERILFAFAAVLMGVAITLSLSRGGMISLGVEMLFLGWLGLRQARRREAARARGGEWRKTASAQGLGQGLGGVFARTGSVAVLLAAMFVGVLWIDAEPVIRRVAKGQVAGQIAGPDTETFFSSRGWIWRDTLKMIAARPLLGVGLGAYATAWPMYSESDELNVSQAHNDYLQVLADTGLVGAALALCFLALAFRAIWRASHAADPLIAGMAAGCGAALAGLLTHSVFDFNLQLPSTSLLFLVITAMVSNLALMGGDDGRTGAG
ncbi:MAG: O-antigen ligase family protein [Blastocatellia bacterium]